LPDALADTGSSDLISASMPRNSATAFAARLIDVARAKFAGVEAKTFPASDSSQRLLGAGS
jgi:hypothetical protein